MPRPATATGRGRWSAARSAAPPVGLPEKASKKRPGLQLVVRLDNGEEVGVQVPLAKKKKNQVSYAPGDRVRLMTGADGTTQVSPETG